jgi:pimeloyl-ACP methyl ester carboxylesterase
MTKALLLTAMMLLSCLAHADDRWMSIPQAPEMPQAEDSGLAKVNGINMYFATYGSAKGVPILMIHGGLAHADIWAPVVIDLMKDHKVIVADSRGHGRSNNDGSVYSYDLLAQDYLALLDYLKVKSVHIVGWSDGANIGYILSSTSPQRVTSHFAHAGNVTLAGVNPAVETNALFASYVGMMGEDYAAMSPTPDNYEAFIGEISAMWGKPSGWGLLAKITAPTLVVHSEYDESILPAHSQKIAESIPGANYLVLKNVSHFAAFQAPGEYALAIREFINPN